jgi:hypothetical protein
MDLRARLVVVILLINGLEKVSAFPVPNSATATYED